MTDDETTTVEFGPGDHERLVAVADAPAEFVREAAMDRIELEEAVAFTREGGFQGPEGFARIMDGDYPTWPLGSRLGIELLSMGDGESRWALAVGPEHANPMGTVHGGVLCDLGDASLGTAYMSTLDPGESFTTVDLTANFLRPVRSGRLEAVGRVVHRGGTIGLAECDVTDEAGDSVARLSGTRMTLRGDG